MIVISAATVFLALICFSQIIPYFASASLGLASVGVVLSSWLAIGIAILLILVALIVLISAMGVLLPVMMLCLIVSFVLNF